MKVFVCQGAALGMEYSLTFITLWLYLETVIKEKYIILFYSLISAAYLMAQIVSSVVFGRIVDRHRNTRMIFLIGNSLVVIGNFLYMLPFSSWCLLAGRLISGGGGCLRSVMTGEIARSFNGHELSSKFSLMGMAFGMGFVLGPGINFAFINTNFWIGRAHITYANAPGLYLAIIFILMQVIASLFVSDLSKEYDLKQHHVEEITRKYKETDPLILNECQTTSSVFVQPMTSFSVFIKVSSHCDTVIVLIFSFMLMYCLVAMDLWQPLVVVELIHWGVLELNIIVLGYGIASVGVMLVLSRWPLNDHAMVYFSIFCSVSVSVMLLIFLAFKLYHTNLVFNIILWVIYGVLVAMVVVMEEIFLIGIMAKMTSSTVQSFTESIRLAASRSGALLALLTTAAAFEYLEYVCTALAIITFLGGILLYWRRKPFQEPKILIK